MNDLLELKARFEHRNRSGGGKRLPPNDSVITAEKLLNIKKELLGVLSYWKDKHFIKGILFSVFCDRTTAKSNRIQQLINAKDPNDCIVGIRFNNNEEKKHVITYYTNTETIESSVKRLDVCINILKNSFSGEISNKKQLEKKIEYSTISQNVFINIITDAAYIEKIEVELTPADIKSTSLVTLYKTDIPAEEILKKAGIEHPAGAGLDDTTVFLTPEQYSVLKEKAPYLIAMSVTDLRKVDFSNISHFAPPEPCEIPEPQSEPVIGVIDSLFDTSAYFNKWVEYKKCVPDEIETVPSDTDHGTMVSSIIVDGPALNPELDDGCGRFRVKHFGVFAGKSYSSFSIIKQIKNIVKANPDIKVWNLSLGSANEISDNFTSPEAAVLDELQYSYDVIFIISGTNNPNPIKPMKIGAPADSVNSIVVNSVRRNDKPASYSRHGPVLGFYQKPDVSYYGGDDGEELKVYSYDSLLRSGTSFAAPWITRKAAYLIYVLGLTRETAKALIIDSASGWKQQKNSVYTGYGTVPIKISDVVNSKDNEIRFILTGREMNYETYFYNLPVPMHEGKYPFTAKATLCYFPMCLRNQGVDYTATEISLSFGRIAPTKEGKTMFKNINNDLQDSEYGRITEKNARAFFRKWDSIKHIAENGKRPKKFYKGKFWGISLKKKERVNVQYGKNMKFCLIITLKELFGKNRIEDFIQQCSMNGILVNRINIEERVKIYNSSQQEIKLE